MGCTVGCATPVATLTSVRLLRAARRDRLRTLREDPQTMKRYRSFNRSRIPAEAVQKVQSQRAWVVVGVELGTRRR